LTTTEAAVAISGGIVALIVILVIGFVVGSGIAGKKVWEYYKHNQTMSQVQSNPMYVGQEKSGSNPLYAEMDEVPMLETRE